MDCGTLSQVVVSNWGDVFRAAWVQGAWFYVPAKQTVVTWCSGVAELAVYDGVSNLPCEAAACEFTAQTVHMAVTLHPWLSVVEGGLAGLAGILCAFMLYQAVSQ